MKYYEIEKRTFGVNTDADGNLLSCFRGKSEPLTKVGGILSRKNSLILHTFLKLN